MQKPNSFGFCCLLAALLLAGCATSVKTPSGRPEVTIAVPKATAKSAVLTHFMGTNNKWALIQESDSLLIFERDAGLAAAIFLGSRYNPTVHQQVRFAFVEDSGTTRVMAGIIMRNGVRDMGENTGSHRQLQYTLDCLKADLEGTPRPPEPPKPPAPPSGRHGAR